MDYDRVLEDKLVPLLQELIRNSCVNDGSPESGNEMKSAQTLARFFKGHGIKGEILASLPHRGNFLLRIPGTDPTAPSLMFMGHLDVVPANAEEWICDPFAGEVRDGHIWGRGCVDMLNMTASMAVATAVLGEQGRFPGDLVFLAVADEEASGHFGADWLVRNHWQKVKCDYMITELGGFFINRAEDAGITITVGEKGVAWTRLRIKGRAGHGSMPYKSDNAALKIAQIARRIERYKPKARFLPVFRQMVEGLVKNPLYKYLLNKNWGRELALNQVYKTEPGIARFLHTGSQMTVSPNRMEAGSKVNIVADFAYLDLDIRILPDTPFPDVVEELKKALGDMAMEVEFDQLEYYHSTVSSINAPLMEASREVVKQVYPQSKLVPFYIGGATDGRFWREKGTTVYGFGLFDRDMTITHYSNLIHSKDERISLKSLKKNLEYFCMLPEVFFRTRG